MFDFSERRAVVTGAASGIGKETALLLLDRGASVVAADISEAGLREVAVAGARVIACDVTRETDRRRLREAAGECHHLVNAAGVIRLLPPEAVAEEDWDSVMDVNAKALFFMCQAFAPILPDDGSIVNLSSVAGRIGATIEASVYAASKAAVLSITRTFAYAHAVRGMRVNAVLPGLIDTPMQDAVLNELARMRDRTSDALREERLLPVPMRRAGAARECAEAILFLLGPGASYITGQALNVDGGFAMY